MITYKFKSKDKEETIEAMSLKKVLLSFGTKAGKTNEDMRKENKWKLNE